ncbi:cytochrome b/b6 domain-containing protein [uncultured Tateyamaria sp.]|uniref:cytochrome b/b6 domain-containing protein n=1 Tax=uncultured Tateyamaria sp. TaxID=455651 RepID=UPI00260BB677|nr:cytochrome b/b6 domain-containing protein [uncultured Tateyamaria sp.]
MDMPVSPGPLVRRHTRITRITHWTWAVCLFFLLLSGLQIFNAHPVLYWGDQSGFEFDNAVLRIGAEDDRGFVELFGMRARGFGVLGISGGAARAFPQWATVPSGVDLATGRVIHFFFAWVFVATLLIWLAGALVAGRMRRDLLMRREHWAGLWSDLAAHLRFRFRHSARYGPLQRLSYGLVLFVLFPLMVLTGLAMSPGANAALPWLPDVLGGRQSARTLHFMVAAALAGFFIVHVAMVLLVGPLNEMRAILTGWYRADVGEVDDV